MVYPVVRRLRLDVFGAVQGVGFRPFVYRLATRLALTGYVINSPRGVSIEVEGEQPALERFQEQLQQEKPPLAIIHSLAARWLAPAGYEAFTIRRSEGGGMRQTLVLPDIATCPDCLSDLAAPHNRRFRYPFTNCTNCGPRLSIIQTLPYDRPNTTMRQFALCPDCQDEYEDPLNRRFHAQPNACPVCGPHLQQWGRESRREPGEPGEQGEQANNQQEWHVEREGDEALRYTAAAIRRGAIAAVKGLGGFHLMADARNRDAVAKLRQRKPRPDKPFALMVRDIAQARSLCDISSQAEALLTSPESPIVLRRRHQEHRQEHEQEYETAEVSIAENIAPGLADLGVMLPYTPLHHLLLHELGTPLVATSGNLSDEPICTDEQDAMQRLGHIADLLLTHNRPIARHVDDSVAWVVDGGPQLLRRARGYAPLPVLVPGIRAAILGVGAHLKNTIALSVHETVSEGDALPAGPTPVFLSQHIGNLETPEALAAFERVVDDFLHLYETTPAIVAHDMHPDYLSTRRAREWAAARGWETLAVQHHHAHLAACLADNSKTHDMRSSAPVLGVTWDGTGYGPDGTIWGGEWLLGNAAGYVRVAHLRPFLLPGGEAAVREPRRAALALLWDLAGDAALEWEDLAPVRSFSPGERQLLAGMLRRRVNAPTTTSAGRLFDAVAALIGLHQQTTFEGQAAIALEQVAASSSLTASTASTDEAYPFDLLQQQPDGGPGVLVFDWRPLVAALLQDLRRGEEQGIMAGRFHQSLIAAIVAVARRVNVSAVALTGGCFQNRLLTEQAAQRLREAGFTVLLHHQVPPNDGGISLGQVVVAAAQGNRE